MKLRCTQFPAFVAVAVAVCLLSGCASAPLSRPDERTEAVKVYEPDALASSRYEVVRQLWVDSWNTAVWTPTYSSEAEGIASLQAEAGRLGADGLINAYCVDRGYSKWSKSSGPAFLCYGIAIRVRQSQG